MKVVARTERTLLREWTDDDLAPFAAMNADPDVMRYFPSILTRAESDASAERIRGSFAERGFGYWALEIHGEIRFAGFVGLAVPSFDLPFTHTDPCVDVGWRLARSTWGKGYATEAARAAMQLGFGAYGLEEIVSFTSVINERSRRVMERLGMTREVDADFDHPRVPEGHPVRRHVLYRTRIAK